MPTDTQFFQEARQQVAIYAVVPGMVLSRKMILAILNTAKSLISNAANNKTISSGTVKLGTILRRGGQLLF